MTQHSSSFISWKPWHHPCHSGFSLTQANHCLIMPPWSPPSNFRYRPDPVLSGAVSPAGSQQPPNRFSHITVTSLSMSLILQLEWFLFPFSGGGGCLSFLLFSLYNLSSFDTADLGHKDLAWLLSYPCTVIHHFSNMIEFIFTSYVFRSLLTSLLSSKYSASLLTWGPKIFAASLETPSGSKILCWHYLCLSHRMILFSKTAHMWYFSTCLKDLLAVSFNVRTELHNGPVSPNKLHPPWIPS